MVYEELLIGAFFFSLIALVMLMLLKGVADTKLQKTVVFVMFVVTAYLAIQSVHAWYLWNS